MKSLANNPNGRLGEDGGRCHKVTEAFWQHSMIQREQTSMGKVLSSLSLGRGWDSKENRDPSHRRGGTPGSVLHKRN